MSLPYSLFDTLLEPVFVLNAEQKVVYCNETAALLTGITARKITRGLNFEHIITFSEPLESIQNLLAVIDPQPYKELEFSNTAGARGKVQIALQPISSPTGEANWIVFVRDVTLEERLQKKYRAELEKKEDVIRDLEQAKEQLQDYSKNLETKVAARTYELSKLNQMMKALLDSLGQGFFVFDKNGLCLEINSKACRDTIESIPAGKMIWDVLKVQAEKVDGFKKWMFTLFSEMLPFEDLAPLGPPTFAHSAQKNISLEYFPLRSDKSELEGIVVVASDITSLVEAKLQAEKEKEKAKLIIHLVKSKKEISRLVHDCESLLHDLQNEINKKSMDFEAVYRYLHTLKGGAASFSIQEMTEACHQAEDQIIVLKKSPSPENIFLFKKFCEAIENAFNGFQSEAKEILGAGTLSFDRQIDVPYSKLNALVSKIQNSPHGHEIATLVVADLMMEPVGSFFEPYKDFSFRLAASEGKNLSAVRFHNSEIPVLSEAYSHLFATFVHAFRNSVDHGLDKQRDGQIDVHFELSNQESELKIRIIDNGLGIDPAKIRAMLEKNNPVVKHESDEQVIQHIFDSQFSTREVVSETSGRGVGMDAIKMAAKQLGGQVFVNSIVGQGTELIVSVPYLLNIPEKNKKAA